MFRQVVAHVFGTLGVGHVARKVKHLEGIGRQCGEDLRQFHDVLPGPHVPTDDGCHALEDGVGDVAVMVFAHGDDLFFEDLFGKGDARQKSVLAGIFSLHHVEQAVGMKREVTVSGEEFFPQESIVKKFRQLGGRVRRSVGENKQQLVGIGTFFDLREDALFHFDTFGGHFPDDFGIFEGRKSFGVSHPSQGVLQMAFKKTAAGHHVRKIVFDVRFGPLEGGIRNINESDVVCGLVQQVDANADAHGSRADDGNVADTVEPAGCPLNQFISV